MIRQYLDAEDGETADQLRSKILVHSDATLEAVTGIIETGRAYGFEPVGVQPQLSLQARGQTYRYGLAVPSTYDPSTPHPLIICLHGAGFTGESYLERWQPRLNEKYILACPTLAYGAWWTRRGEDLVLATIKTIQSRYRIDSNRIFLTGMSNGGIGAWIIGMYHADLFAGIAPIASGIDDVLYPFLDNLRQTAVYIIHGSRDRIMPVGLSRELTRELARLGVSHVYREHDRAHPHAGGHFFPREELPALVKWFDTQHRHSLPRQVTVVRDATHLTSLSWARIDSTEDPIAAFSENLIDSRDEFIDGRIYAKLEAQIVGVNHIVVNSQRVRRYSLFLNENLVDLSKPAMVETNGKVSHQDTVNPQLATLLHEARFRQDPHRLFPAQVVIEVSD